MNRIIYPVKNAARGAWRTLQHHRDDIFYSSAFSVSGMALIYGAAPSTVAPCLTAAIGYREALRTFAWIVGSNPRHKTGLLPSEEKPPQRLDYAAAAFLVSASAFAVTSLLIESLPAFAFSAGIVSGSLSRQSFKDIARLYTHRNTGMWNWRAREDKEDDAPRPPPSRTLPPTGLAVAC